MSALQGKISVKHYLNTKLKPAWPPGDEVRYPVYIRVGFNRKQTDIKSLFVLFDDDVIDDPFPDAEMHEECYLSEKEFKTSANPRTDLFRFFEAERNAIADIVQLIGRLGVNPLTESPGEIFESLLWTISTVFSKYSNGIFMEKLLEFDPDLGSIIDWDSPFTIIFKALERHSDKNFRSWLNEHAEDLYKANIVLQESLPERSTRIYTMLINQSTVTRDLPTDIVKQLKKAIQKHLTIHLSYTHPLLFEDFEKILKK